MSLGLGKQIKQAVSALSGDSREFGTTPSSPTRGLNNQLLKTYGISELLPYESYDPATGLFLNNSSLGFVLETPPLVGCSEQMQTVVSGIFRDLLPEGGNLQCMLWADPRIGDMLDDWEASRAGQGEVLELLAKKRVEFLKSKVFSGDGSVCFRNFRFIFSYSQKGNFNDPIVRQRVITLMDQMSMSLKTLDLPLMRWDASDLIQALDGLLEPKFDLSTSKRTWNRRDSLRAQVPQGVSLQVTKDALVVNEGEFYTRVYGVSDEPRQWSLYAMGELIGDMHRDYMRIPCPFIIHYGVHVPEQKNLSTKMNVRASYAERQSTPSLLKFMPHLREEAMEFSYARERLAEGERLVRTNMSVILMAPSHLQSESDHILKTLFKTKGWALKPDRFIQLQTFLGCLPMLWGEGIYEDLHYHGRMKTTLSTESANLVPLQGEWNGTQSNGILLSGRRGKLFKFSPFDNDRGNYNMKVVGRSGSGKSFFMQENLACTLGMGGRGFVLDVGRSFDKTCHLLNGQFVEFSTQSPICINPFTTIPDHDPKETDDALAMLKPIMSLMAAPTRGTDDIENALLEKAIKGAWDAKKHKASIDTVSQWLLSNDDQRSVDLGTMMFPYTSAGSYGRFFNGDSSINFKNKLVVIELSELKERKDLQGVVVQTVVMQIMNQMILGDRKTPTTIKMDEVWDILSGKQAQGADFVESGVRQARKFYGSLVFGTQSVNDFYASPAAIAAFENSDWLCMLSQSKESIAQLKKCEKLSIDPALEELLNSVRTQQGSFAEIMIMGPYGSTVGRLMTDDFTRILYSTKPAEYSRVKDLQSKGMSLVDAISQVAKEVSC